MYKEYMLKCEDWGIHWKACGEKTELYFDTEKEMREYIESQGKGIKVEAMFKLTKIEW